MKPLILMSNDDGIGSPNLLALADAIEEAGLAEVMVVAPERERSAASHTITLHKPVRLHEYGPGRYALSGTPVDCVYVGVIKLTSRLPDLVISGINRGYNLGSDVFYSGTVAAAVEGGLRGSLGIAFSIDPSPSRDLQAALRFAVALIAAALEHPRLPSRTVLNVNFPAYPASTYAWTSLGERLYREDVAERTDPRGRPYYWIGGGVVAAEPQPGTDCDAVANGLVSVTPLHLDLTAHRVLAQAPAWDLHGFQPVTASGSSSLSRPSKPGIE